MTLKPQHSSNENRQRYVEIPKIRTCSKRQTLKSIPSLKKNKHLMTLSIVLYQNLVFISIIFVTSCCLNFLFYYPFVAFLFLNATPLGTPFFLLTNQNESASHSPPWLRAIFSGRKKPVFSFTPSICLIWIAIQRLAIFEAPMGFLRTIFCTFCAFLWTTYFVMIFIVMNSIYMWFLIM